MPTKTRTRRQAGVRKKKIAKKKTEAKKAAPRIPKDLYWKWRTATEALEHEQTRLSLVVANKENLTQQIAFHNAKIEALNMQVLIANRTLKDQNKTSDTALNEYNEIVSLIEEKIGRSLASTEIDPVTFSVIDDID